MKLSEYIKQLQEILDKEGDLTVKALGFNGVFDKSKPHTRNMKLLKPRERRPCYWEKWDGEYRKGEKVVAV